MAFEDFSDLDAGDETRRHGDYVGFPHGEEDGAAVGGASVAEGQPVEYDEGSDELVEADGEGPIAGVLFTYPVYGDSSNDGPYIAGDKNATVKTSGTVVADLSAFNGEDGVDEGDEGSAYGEYGEIYVINVFDEEDNLAEVLVR